MNKVLRFVIPVGIATCAIAAGCAPAAPTPPPADATVALPSCDGSTAGAVAAAGAPEDGGPGPASADDDVVLVAVDEAGRPRIDTTDVPGAVSTNAAWRADPDLEVVGIELDQVMTVGAAADPYRPQQWGLDDLHAEQVWNTGSGAGIDIAVVDTGVLGTHPDFSGRICSGVAYLGSTGVAQVGQGAVDGHGHGTHVAGIAAAGRNDGIGVAGVAPSARLIPVRVLDGAGNGTSADVARGITWAVDHGAEIVNLSLGGGYSVAVDSAVQYADAHGVLVVAAAGNDGPSGPPNYPAALPDPLAVASYDEGGAVSAFSTRGAYVDIAAPGSGIVSAYKDGRWTYMSGTSMATPHVSGAAAVLLGSEPGLSPAQVRQRLESTAVDTGPIGHDDASGWGNISLVDALAG